MPKGGRQVLFDDKCLDCNELLSKQNTIFKGVYLQPRCKTCYHLYTNKVPSRSKESRASQYIEWKFGITIEEYNKKLELQLNGCAICKSPCEVRDRLAVDHDHKTNKIRDLLCHRCNVVLGLMNEDENLFINMIEYLKKFQDKIA